MTPELIRAIGAAIVDAEADPEIRAVVLTGTGDRAFCAGMDLRDLRRPAPTWRSATTTATATASSALIEGRANVPLVGAANGTAVAGGFELLLGCDVIVASADAEFGLPEVKRGLFAGAAAARSSARASRWASRSR